MSAYTNLDDAVELVQSLAQVEIDDAVIELKLQASAGKAGAAISIGDETIPKDATVFRFYYVCAKLVEQSRDDQSLVSADGAKFTGLTRPIVSWLLEQYAIDNAYGLIVPSGFDCVLALQGIVGLDKTIQLTGGQSVTGGLREISPPIDDIIRVTSPYARYARGRW